MSQLEQRVIKLSEAVPGVVRYQRASAEAIVGVSPLFVTIRAAPPAAQLFSGALRELHRPLPPEEAYGDFTRMARVVMTLHRRGIVHGHLTLASWREDDRTGGLFVVDAAVPLAAVPSQAPMLQRAAALLAPEVVAVAGSGSGSGGAEGAAPQHQQMVSPAADVWGLAVCYLQLVLPEKYSTALERADIIDADIMCPLVADLPPQIVSILVRCLKQDALARPSVEELFCELIGQPTSRQAAIMAAMADDARGDNDSDDDEAEEEEEQEEEESDDESSDGGEQN